MSTLVTSMEIRTPGLFRLEDLRNFVRLAAYMSDDTLVQLNGRSAGTGYNGDDAIRLQIMEEIDR